jgi:hypothetical protein
MRQVREVLRLKHVAGHSERRIAAAIGISRSARADWPHRYVGPQIYPISQRQAVEGLSGGSIRLRLMLMPQGGLRRGIR